MKIPVPEKTIGWLCEPDNPPVRYLTMKHLSGLPETDGELREVYNSIHDYRPINIIADSRTSFLPGPDQKYRPYKKYQGLYWQIIFLGDFLANASDPRIEECCEAVLSLQKDNGGFRFAEMNIEIMCLNGNLLRGLIAMGYAEHPRVQKGIDHVARTIVEHNGIPCTVMEYTVYDTCYMTAPRTLRALAAYPKHLRTDAVKEAMAILCDSIYENKIYRYVRSNAKQFDAALKLYIKSRGKTTKEERKEFKELFLRDNPGDPHTEKKGWKRFAFPLHYNTNILETLTALIEAEDIRKDVLAEAIEIVVGKMQPGSTWKMDDSLNGKMHADIEKKGQPGKWNTFYALYVLKHLRGLDFIQTA
ncbi:hypothetical protein ACFL6L_04015 [candidate division KSB1 bacterium]